MRNRIMTVTVVLAVAGCAGAPPVDTLDPVRAEQAPATAEESPAGEEEIEVAEVPSVPATAVAADRSGRVCRNERRTGTNRVVRVCRTRAEIERQQVEGKEVFDDLHDSQQEY